MSKRIQIAGVSFNKTSYKKVLDFIASAVDQNTQGFITTPNPEMVVNATEDEVFRQVLEDAAIAIPDGIGILWAATYLDKPMPKAKIFQWLQLYVSLAGIILWPKSIRKLLPNRVTGVDMFKKIVDASQEKKWRIFLLGAREGVAKKAIHKLKKKYPKANIVGFYPGSPDTKDEEGIIERIKKVKPDILFVAYGSPAQENWIHRNLFKIPSVNVAMGVGGAFDFVAGTTLRAPKFIQKLGLEWLWRFGHQPKRHRRIKNATHGFIRLVHEEKKYNG